MPDELKPCPFCGSDPVIPASGGVQVITCPKCGLVMNGPTQRRLIATWNKRTFRIAQARGVIPEAFKDER